jgi:hypothetical protein
MIALLPPAVHTEATRQAERLVRDPALFKWYAVALLAFVIYAPLWASTGPTAYQFLVGLNVEISFMFALAGVVYVKLLPADRRARVLGMPGRLAVALGLSIVSVAVELFLHASGTFHWHYWWWNTPFVPLIVVFGYLWFYLFAAWVYDAPDPRTRWRRVGALAALDVAMGLVFGVGFGWL